MSFWSAVTQGAFMVVGILIGAPQVAKLNNHHEDNKERKQSQHDRISEWGSTLNLPGSSRTRIADFRIMPANASLKQLLPADLVQRADIYFLLLERTTNASHLEDLLLRGREFIRELLVHFVRVEREWGLLEQT